MDEVAANLFICPQCHGRNCVVKHTWPVVPYRRRRRQCLACGHVFFTIESIENGQHEPAAESTPVRAKTARRRR